MWRACICEKRKVYASCCNPKFDVNWEHAYCAVVNRASPLPPWVKHEPPSLGNSGPSLSQQSSQQLTQHGSQQLSQQQQPSQHLNQPSQRAGYDASQLQQVPSSIGPSVPSSAQPSHIHTPPQHALTPNSLTSPQVPPLIRSQPDSLGHSSGALDGRAQVSQDAYQPGSVQASQGGNQQGAVQTSQGGIQQGSVQLSQHNNRQGSVQSLQAGPQQGSVLSQKRSHDAAFGSGEHRYMDPSLGLCLM